MSSEMLMTPMPFLSALPDDAMDVGAFPRRFGGEVHANSPCGQFLESGPPALPLLPQKAAK
jgi:hypothetical protein